MEITSVERRNLFFLTAASIVFGLALLAFALLDFITVGVLPGYYCMLACPLFLLLLLGFFSFNAWIKRPKDWLSRLPLLVNGITIVLVALVMLTASLWDIPFYRNASNYNEAAQLIQSGQLQANDYGAVSLPKQYRGLSITDKVMVKNQGTVTTLFFTDDSQNLDDFAWGYLYRSDGSQPDESSGCVKWRAVRPEMPNWFYCEIWPFSSGIPY